MTVMEKTRLVELDHLGPYCKYLFKKKKPLKNNCFNNYILIYLRTCTYYVLEIYVNRYVKPTILKKNTLKQSYNQIVLWKLRLNEIINKGE